MESLPLVIVEAAYSEWIEAIEYYESQQKHLGTEFKKIIQSYLRRIQLVPLHIISKEKKNTGKFTVSRFHSLLYTGSTKQQM